jgi:hypothetical protein
MVVNKKNIILFVIGLIIITIVVSILMNRIGTPVYINDPYKQKIDSLNIELKYIKNKCFFVTIPNNRAVVISLLHTSE